MIIYLLENSNERHIRQQITTLFSNVEQLSRGDSRVFFITAVSAESWPFTWVMAEEKRQSEVRDNNALFVDQHAFNSLAMIINSLPTAREYTMTSLQYIPREQSFWWRDQFDLRNKA